LLGRKKSTIMNTIQAKNIPLVDFLSNLGIEPERKYKGFYWYLDPRTNERNASLKINLEKNTWFNVAANQGGTIIDFAMSFYNCDIKEALSKIAQGMGEGVSPFLSAKQKEIHAIQTHKPEIKAIKPIGNNTALNHYLVKERGIPLELATLYLKEIYYTIIDTKGNQRQLFGVGIENLEGGYEISHAFKTDSGKWYKSSVGKKYFSHIQAQKGSFAPAIAVFESFIDFLSCLAHYQGVKPSSDICILNSISFANESLRLLSGYDQVNLLLDNDKAGNEATDFYLKEKESNPAKKDDTYLDFRHLYKDFKDYNDFLIKR
jgi:hypothetical protein